MRKVAPLSGVVNCLFVVNHAHALSVLVDCIRVVFFNFLRTEAKHGVAIILIVKLVNLLPVIRLANRLHVLLETLIRTPRNRSQCGKTAKNLRPNIWSRRRRKCRSSRLATDAKQHISKELRCLKWISLSSLELLLIRNVLCLLHCLLLRTRAKLCLRTLQARSLCACTQLTQCRTSL